MAPLGIPEVEKSPDAPLTLRMKRLGRKVRSKIIPRSRQQKYRPNPKNTPSRASTFSSVAAHDGLPRRPKEENQKKKASRPTSSTNTAPQLENTGVASHPADTSLWAQAYCKANEDPDFVKLLESYKDFLVERYSLSKEESTILLESLVQPTSQEQTTPIQKIAKRTLEDLESTRLTFSIGDHKVVVREQVKKILDILMPFKAVIGAAAAAEPSASLAWTCVMAALPFLDNIIKQDESAAEGFERISFILVRYALLERDLLQENPGTSVPMSVEYCRVIQCVKERMVKVYVAAYEYQIRIILQYAHTKPRRMLGDIFLRNDWKTMTTDIGDNDLEIDRTVNTLIQSSLRDDLKRINESICKRVVDSHKEISTKLNISILDRLPFVQNAVFNSVAVDKQGKCLIGTQRNALNDIQAWAESPDGEPIFWLSGMAGTGKSTIATTVANCLNDRKQFFNREPGLDERTFLAATFFLSHEDPTRNTVKHVFSTIARTMAERFPDLGEHISQKIHSDTTIGSARLVEQMKSLISEPLAIVSKTCLVAVRLIIVIDSVDECEETSEASQLLRLLLSLGRFHPMDLRILVVSRPEKHITQILDDPKQRVRRFTLEKIPSQIDRPEPDDITKFLRHEIKSITKRRDLMPDWIKSDEIRQLVERAGGLFIYAATTCRFLDAIDDDEIQRLRLGTLMEGAADDGTPEARLDEIYRKVLAFPTRNISKKETDVVFARYRCILGTIALAFESPSLVTIGNLTNRQNIRKTLLDFRSILEVPPDDQSPVSFYHLSFRDFLLDNERSGTNFFINIAQVHRDLFLNCLAILEKSLKQDMCDIGHPGVFASDIPKTRVYNYIPQHVRYACLYWSDHLTKHNTHKSISTYLDDEEEVYKFLSTKLLYWLEVLSLLGEYHRSVSIIRQLQSLATPEGSPMLFPFLQDAYRFVLSNNETISQAPLQTYCSALIFSPCKSIVRSKFRGLIPAWITSYSDWKDDWGADLMAINGECDQFDISKDGKLLAASTWHYATKVWDITTGSEIANYQHSSQSRQVAISRDNTIIATLLTDTISLRSLKDEVETILTCNTAKVRSIVASPAEDVLASLSVDYEITLWDLKSFNIIEQIVFDEGEYYHSQPLVFSPCGQVLLAGCGRATVGGIFLWNSHDQTGKKIRKHEHIVTSIAVSPDGEKIASGDDVGIIKVWSKTTGATEKEIHGKSPIIWIAWHPKKVSTLAVGFTQLSIQLYNIATTPPQITKQIDLPGATTIPVNGLAFTGNLSVLASADFRGCVRLWDTEVASTESATREKIQSIYPLRESKHKILLVLRSSSEILDLRTGSRQPFLSGIRKVVCSQGQDHFAFGLEDDRVQLWDNTLERLIDTFTHFTDVFFPKGGMYVVLMSRNKSLVLDYPTLNQQFQVTLPEDWVPGHGPIFTSRAIGIVTRGDEKDCNKLWLFRWDTGKLVPGFPHFNVLNSETRLRNRTVFMSADGQLVIYETAAENNHCSFVAIDVEADYHATIFTFGNEQTSTAPEFSPTRRRAIVGTASGTLIVLDMENMALVRLPTGTVSIIEVHYCTGERVLVTTLGHGFREKQLWDMEKKQLLKRWTSDENIIGSIFHAGHNLQHYTLKGGWLPLPIGDNSASCSLLNARVPDLLDVEGGWVWKGNDRLLRLPSDFATKLGRWIWEFTSCTELKWPVKAVSDGSLIIESESGELVVFKFDKPKMFFKR